MIILDIIEDVLESTTINKIYTRMKSKNLDLKLNDDEFKNFVKCEATYNPPGYEGVEFNKSSFYNDNDTDDLPDFVEISSGS